MNTAARIWGLNHRLLTAVMNSCSEQLDELGLDTKEFFVLGEVDECRYPAELAARLMMPKASVTVYLRNLVAKGFVQREIDEGDLRRHRLVVTPDGQKVLDRALATLSDNFEQWLARLETQERDELQRLLEKLLRHQQ
ncbi:MarR family winged helix-turn-helix transcriptional regulator [Nonomuraea sp. NPDC048882]|uniref:MarR family winged helix-turn-helix transcriptional regulator n=1 Tax=unclassified Nonomuraea TaxID=2593643 RepID=UPI000A54D7AC